MDDTITAPFIIKEAPGASHIEGCTIIGFGVPLPELNHVIRIGSHGVYLEISAEVARIVGAEPDEATQAVLDGLAHASDTILRRFKEASGFTD